MSAIHKCKALEWAAYHLDIYTKHASESKLVTQTTHFFHKSYRGIGTRYESNSSVRQLIVISTPPNTVLQ